MSTPKTDNQDSLYRRRIKAVSLRVEGKKVNEISRLCNLSSRTVISLWTAYLDGGWDAIQLKPRGRKFGDGRILNEICESEILNLLTYRTPDDLGSEERLWSRDVLSALLKHKYDVSITSQGLGKYLKMWDLIPNKTLWHSYSTIHQYELLWLDSEYQKILAQSKVEKSTIFWISMRRINPKANLNKALTSSYEGINGKFLLSAINNQGKGYWIIKSSITSEVLQDFYFRVMNTVSRKVIAIAQDMGDPEYKKMRQFLRKHHSKIELINVRDAISSRLCKATSVNMPKNFQVE